MAFRTGQGSTEYLVLLAVVLIIALVAIALLGFFPGLSTDAKITQSASYWKAGRPFAILDHRISGTNATLVIQNMDSTGSLTINSISLGASATNSTVLGSPTFAPGEVKTVTSINAPSGSVGTVYDLAVVINYTSANSLDLSQTGGSKTLVGKYV